MQRPERQCSDDRTHVACDSYGWVQWPPQGLVKVPAPPYKSLVHQWWILPESTLDKVVLKSEMPGEP